MRAQLSNPEKMYLVIASTAKQSRKNVPRLCEYSKAIQKKCTSSLREQLSNPEKMYLFFASTAKQSRKNNISF